MIDIDTIQNSIKKVGEKIDLPKGMLLFIGDKKRDDAIPYLEIRDNEFHYIVRERGIEFSRKITSSLDELLYWFFYDIASQLSIDYELKNRVCGQDSRRISFSKKAEILGVLSPVWAERWDREMQKILEKNPYLDSR